MIPPDEETKSTDKATFERAKRDIANCDSNKQLLDTLTVDHLLWKLSSNSPIDRRHLPYYERYLIILLFDVK